jgi:hypothetical protein
MNLSQTPVATPYTVPTFPNLVILADVDEGHDVWLMVSPGANAQVLFWPSAGLAKQDIAANFDMAIYLPWNGTFGPADTYIVGPFNGMRGWVAGTQSEGGSRCVVLVSKKWRGESR